mmetsp:Transcript_15104/g.22981  ORF Transcript_15104/g.22981 Transcript_15104/m.22981 type:complete len:372 (-) Transcript_15104:310-1425(-)
MPSSELVWFSHFFNFEARAYMYFLTWHLNIYLLCCCLYYTHINVSPRDGPLSFVERVFNGAIHAHVFLFFWWMVVKGLQISFFVTIQFVMNTIVSTQAVDITRERGTIQADKGFSLRRHYLIDHAQKVRIEIGTNFIDEIIQKVQRSFKVVPACFFHDVKVGLVFFIGCNVQGQYAWRQQVLRRSIDGFCRHDTKTELLPKVISSHVITIEWTTTYFLSQRFQYSACRTHDFIHVTYVIPHQSFGPCIVSPIFKKDKRIVLDQQPGVAFSLVRIQVNNLLLLHNLTIVAELSSASKNFSQSFNGGPSDIGWSALEFHRVWLWTTVKATPHHVDHVAQFLECLFVVVFCKCHNTRFWLPIGNICNFSYVVPE